MAHRQDQDNDQIRITHYINPHNFWFKQESAYLFNTAEQDFQQELNQFCEETYGRGNIVSGAYTPRREGETVAVFYFQQARWIRAEVDEIQQDLRGQVQCNLWAIDEGIPVKTSIRYIKPLPERFAAIKTSVMRGGLEGILPAECSYDYLQGFSVNKIVPEWSPGVVRVFEGCIEEAVSINFSSLHHYQVVGTDMYFGEMKITSHQNVTNSATDLLKKAGGQMVMLVDQREFYDQLPTLRTLDIRRFEDNERIENMKFHTNTFQPEYTARCKMPSAEKTRVPKHMIDQAREKFLEWDKRNVALSCVNTSIIQVPTVSSTTIAANEKPNRPPVRAYSPLVNESISDDDEEEPPQIEIKLPANQPKRPPPKQVNQPQNASAYQRPQNRIYDKNVSDVDIALNKIKLRRQAAALNQKSTETFKSNRSSVGTASVLNIMPAGYSLGNVDFSTGSVVLGHQESVPGRGGPSSRSTGNNSLKHRNQRFEHRKDEHDSSSEEEIVRKLTMTAIKADDDDEQW